MRAENGLLSIVYVSSAAPGFRGALVADMVRRAREKNAALDITGCLLHYDGSFMQYLEGPRDAVLQLYALIETDPRHAHVVEVHRGDQAQRVFSSWTMEFAQPGEQAWSDLYRMAATERIRTHAPSLAPLFGTFLLSGDRYLAFRS